MQSSTERPEFTPPAEGGWPRAVGLAVLAHLVLLGALSWGLKWKHDDPSVAVEAELWASTPQQAAPKPVETPPAPPPQPAPPPPAPAPAPPVQRDADIVLQQEKERQAREKERQEQEKARREAEAERQRQLAADKRKREEEAQRKEEAARKQEQEQQQLAEKRKREAEDKRKQEQAKARTQQEEARLAKLREENMRRIQGLAGATGGPEATGTALRSSGPSAGYAGRIRAAVKPNIVFTDDVPGNPTAVVEVRLAPDGTIVGKRIVRSSGAKTWDDAVLRALDRTEVLPRDVDGRVVTPMELVFRPKD